MLWPVSRAEPYGWRMANNEASDYAKRLSNVLRELRAVTGWGQEEAAEQIGVSVSTLSRWERGLSAPKGFELGRLFQAYQPAGAEPAWFFAPPEVVVINPIRNHLVELARVAAALPPATSNGAAEVRRRAGVPPAGPRDTPRARKLPRSQR